MVTGGKGLERQRKSKFINDFMKASDAANIVFNFSGKWEQLETPKRRLQLRPRCKTLLEAITLDKNQRQAIPTNLTKNEKEKLSGQNIDYHKLDDQHKSLVDKSRAEEWKSGWILEPQFHCRRR